MTLEWPLWIARTRAVAFGLARALPVCFLGACFATLDSGDIDLSAGAARSARSDGRSDAGTPVAVNEPEAVSDSTPDAGPAGEPPMEAGSRESPPVPSQQVADQREDPEDPNLSTPRMERDAGATDAVLDSTVADPNDAANDPVPPAQAPDDDQDGVPNDADRCPGTPPPSLAEVAASTNPDPDADGCVNGEDRDDDGDGIGDDDELRLGTDPLDPTQRPRVLLVSAASASAAPDGLSWETAYPNPQAALDALSARQAESPGPGEIWVAVGVYFPDEGPNRTDGDRTQSFVLARGMALYGGFDGVTHLNRDDRVPEAYLTVLSGDLDQDDTRADPVGLPADATDLVGENALSVVTANDTDATTILDGVTIAAGDAVTLAGVHEGHGGGLHATGAMGTFRGLRLQANRAERGGGAFLVGASIQESRFVGNRTASTGYGAGLYCLGCTGTSAQLMFELNVADLGTGGGIMLDQCALELVDVTMRSNSAARAGGIGMARSVVTVRRAEIYDNAAVAKDGGGVHVSGSTVTIEDSVIANNESSWGGAGIFGQDRTDSVGSLVLYNVVLGGNFGGSNGGGLQCAESEAERFKVLITNASIASNFAAAFGGGFHCPVASLAVHNSLIWYNRAGLGDLAQQTVGYSGVNPFFHSLVEAVTDTSQGNLDASSKPVMIFARAANRELKIKTADLRVWDSSPTLNAGNNAAPRAFGPTPATAGDAPLDVRGKPRVQDGTIDLGAYEGGP